MNTIRKIRKNAKALSPVVASIILIAVTVAVSIAVAAWMGALSVGFMQTEHLQLTNADFSAAGSIRLSVRNTGTIDIVVDTATVNGATSGVAMQNATSGAALTAIPKNSNGVIVVTYPWVAGESYQIRLLSTKGTWFPYNAVAP